MRPITLAILYTLIMLSCKPKVELSAQSNQEEVIDKYLKNGAWRHHYLTKEWDNWINQGLQIDSTIAYLWQQKALPFWKKRKYSMAISYYNHAVEFDKEKWLSRLGFLKCIFAKDYQSALTDLVNYKKEFGSTYEQDHLLEFYIGLCCLQLGQYEQALSVLSEMVHKEEMKNGTDWVHYLDRFYLAIAHYELSQYEKAMSEFDLVLNEYPSFSDAQYYQSICLSYIGEQEAAKNLMLRAQSNFKLGHSFNEDASTFEIYPYQLTWQWNSAMSMLKNHTPARH